MSTVRGVAVIDNALRADLMVWTNGDFSVNDNNHKAPRLAVPAQLCELNR